MDRPKNLADPEFEPTDEELVELSRRAFEGVAAAMQDDRERLRASIAAQRREVLAALRR